MWSCSRGARFTAMVACISSIALAPAPALGTECVATCGRQVKGRTRTTCAALRGEARRACRATCEGRAGCRSSIGTLAYVETQCRNGAQGLELRQALKIRRGDCEAVTVMELAGPPLPDPVGLCAVYGAFRTGDASMVSGAFQRLGVSRDGRAVVFEVTTDLAVLPVFSVPPEQQGFYFVRSDGSGLHRLGPPSRMAAFQIVPLPSSPIGFGPFELPLIPFSPSGRMVAFSDLGPGPAGEEASQIVTLDVTTGRRTQVTHLPFATSTSPLFPATGFPGFVDDEKISFASYANGGGLNPTGNLGIYTTRTDGTGLRLVSIPTPVAVPGARVLPTFQLLSGRTSLHPLTMSAPGVAMNSNPLFSGILEAYLLDRKRLLQLTNLHRADTLAPFLSVDGNRVFFEASGDPLGTNPDQNCQLFSIDTLGANLRQLTHFGEGGMSVNGCAPGPPPGCAFNFPGLITQDRMTQTVVFESSCDPLGTNPDGSQVYAMRPDGSALRQLTHSRGFVIEADGAVVVELPGPMAYSTTP